MRSLALIAFGFALLVVGSTLAALVPLHGYAPNLLLPIAIFLGVTAEVSLVRGALSCFVLGYLVDSFTGNPMGLETFAFVASFLVARGAGLRLLPHGPVFQIVLTLVMGLASEAMILTLRAIFERAFHLDLHDNGTALLRSATATALCAPLVFPALPRIVGGNAPRRDRYGAAPPTLRGSAA